MKVRKAVITAAGRGTRQYPATSIVQKELLPLVDTDGLTKPVLQIIIGEAMAGGIEEVCIVVSPGDEEQFRQYFRGLTEDMLPAFAGKEWALKASERLSQIQKALTFVTQHTPEGYGHAVYQAKDFVGNEPFLLLLGDHIYLSNNGDGGRARCAKQLIDAYQAAGAEAMSAVKPTPAHLLHLFGVMKGSPIGNSGRLYRVEAIKEKPTVEYAEEHLATPGVLAGHYLAHFGMHVFPPAIFEAIGHHIKNDLREKKEIQLTSAQEYMRTELIERYDCFDVHGERYDTGIPFGLMETQIALALAGVHRQEIVESLAVLLTKQLATVKKQ
jgi:UTP--glucose-1-phosphate uridylyltransferase